MEYDIIREKILSSFRTYGFVMGEKNLEINCGKSEIVEVSCCDDVVEMRFDIDFGCEKGDFEGNQIDLWKLWIHNKQFRGRGLGTRLDEAVLDLARKFDLGKVLVSGIYFDSEKFWFEKRGYAPSGSGTLGLKVLD